MRKCSRCKQNKDKSDFSPTKGEIYCKNCRRLFQREYRLRKEVREKFDSAGLKYNGVLDDKIKSFALLSLGRDSIAAEADYYLQELANPTKLVGALSLLGLQKENLNQKTLKKAYLLKSNEVHPDKGGSHTAMSKINSAKATLDKYLKGILNARV